MLDKIQVHYQPVEDRLALLITLKAGDNLNLWLTRRVTQKLLSNLGALVKKDEAVVSQNTDQRKEHVQEFQKVQAAEKSQFVQERINQKEQAAITDMQLVVDTRLDDKTLRLPLTSGKTLNLDVSTQLAYILTNLLNSALVQTRWGISPEPKTSGIEFTHQKYPTMTLN